MKFKIEQAEYLNSPINNTLFGCYPGVSPGNIETKQLNKGKSQVFTFEKYNDLSVFNALFWLHHHYSPLLNIIYRAHVRAKA